MIRRQSLKQSV